MRYPYCMGAVRIYGIVDPRCGEVRYVGKTSDSYARRLRGHYARARDKATPVGAWLLKLEQLGLKPEFITLEEQPLDWRAAERRWIAHYRKLYPGKMKNVADGGQGGNPTRSGSSMNLNEILSRSGTRSYGTKEWTPERRAALSAKYLARRLECNTVQYNQTMV